MTGVHPWPRPPGLRALLLISALIFSELAFSIGLCRIFITLLILILLQLSLCADHRCQSPYILSHFGFNDILRNHLIF